MAEDEGGEGELFAFEKLMQVTRRQPLPLRDCGNGQIAVAEIRCYVGHDRAQPRGTDAAPLRDCVAVSCGADSQRDEIVNVGCDKSLELRRVQRLLFLRDRAGIRNKQFNRLRACRNHADQSVVDATGEWCNSVAWYPKTQEVYRRRMDEVEADRVRASSTSRPHLAEPIPGPRRLRYGTSAQINADQKIVLAAGDRSS